MEPMDLAKLPCEIDPINYIAIEILEKIGITLPDEQQINFVETILQQFKFQMSQAYLSNNQKLLELKVLF